MECDAEKLLALIEQRPPIYNFKIKEYCNRVIIDKLWDEISREMGATVVECKNKWANLRNSYNRAVRDGRNAKSGSEGSKKRKWYLMDAMGFLTDFVGVHRKLGSNTESSEASGEIPAPEESSESSMVYDQVVLSPDNHEDTVGQPFADNKSFTPPSVRKRPAAAIDKVAEPMITFLQSRTKPKEPENPTLTFFKSLIPDIDKLTESRKRRFKQNVLNELYSQLDEQEHI